MTDNEYQDKKRECWEEFKRTNLDGEVQWQPVNRYDVFCAVFDRAYVLGKHEKDAEGEEMQTCEKSKAMQLYSHLLDLVENERMSEYYSKWCDLEREYIALFGENVFADYFGSKCLPDAHEDNFTRTEPKPSEPKFKIGDELALDKRIVVKVDEVFADGKYLVYSRIGNIYMVKESDLKPYTEQREDLIPPNSGELESQEADKQCNTIIKDSFAKERRLNIATTIAAGWLACHGMTNPKTIAIDALAVADTLMAEAEKGGTDGED